MRVQVSGSGSNSQGSSSSGDYLTPFQQALSQQQAAYIQQALGNLNYGGSGAWQQALGETGGPRANFGTMHDLLSSMPKYPDITVGPIWNNQQINDRVNLMRGQNDAATAGQARRAADSFAGRGYGANSPLNAAITSNLYAQNRGANAENENNLRWQAAEGNAQHRLRSELANLSRTQMIDTSDFGRRKAMSDDEFRRLAAAAEDDIARRQVAMGRYAADLTSATARQNSLLNALNFQLEPRKQSSSSQKSDSWSAGFADIPSVMELSW